MGLVFSKRRIHSDSGAKLSRGFLQLTAVHEDQSMHEMEMSAVGLHFQHGLHAFECLLMVT